MFPKTARSCLILLICVPREETMNDPGQVYQGFDLTKPFTLHKWMIKPRGGTLTSSFGFIAVMSTVFHKWWRQNCLVDKDGEVPLVMASLLALLPPTLPLPLLVARATDVIIFSGSSCLFVQDVPLNGPTQFFSNAGRLCGRFKCTGHRCVSVSVRGTQINVSPLIPWLLDAHP